MASFGVCSHIVGIFCKSKAMREIHSAKPSLFPTPFTNIELCMVSEFKCTFCTRNLATKPLDYPCNVNDNWAGLASQFPPPLPALNRCRRQRTYVIGMNISQHQTVDVTAHIHLPSAKSGLYTSISM
ncbi:hypothetical protein GDO78_020079 [Eleutherodactylus coqui]|uniref:Uncharacterized protein n=1 Tax=Eleutherodactylus coqui TaxID=57060 RepID=A0A8J6ECE7_ELECQ|nr:hypothetical protein GDO78_020079 [Eleutherodactylus coqui]